MNQTLVDTCLRYLDGDLTEQELQAFNRLLVESSEAADLLVQLSLDEQHYRATPASAQEQLLPELLHLQASAEPSEQEVAWYEQTAALNQRPDETYRSTLQVLSDVGFWGYLGRTALCSTPAKWAGAAAAVVLLALALVAVFSGGPSTNPQGPGVAGVPDAPNEWTPDATQMPSVNPTVATLTAQHNAIWAEGASAPGSLLRAGQRLTLTQGFAEITTNEGAIAIIQAPATIELLNNDNALHLHAGKLVGICETEASKGFTVRTPHMDITDLGTRFGVDTQQGATEVHVLDGEVEVARTSLAGDAVIRESIVAGDAVLASSSSDQLTRIQTNDLRFATLLAFDADLSERRGLVAHWRFDDPQRLGLNARRGVEDLQAQGDATHTPQGRFGGGLLLDGDGDALVAAMFPDGIPTGGAAHTVALWIKPTATGKGGFYSWGTAKRVDRSTGLRFHEDGVSHYFWEANGLNDLMATEQAVAGVGVAFAEGGWTHVALTWDGHTRKLYLNGLLVVEGIRQAPDVTPDNFMIGSTPSYGGFAGTLDEVVVFGRALAPEEIAAVMQGDIPQTP